MNGVLTAASALLGGLGLVLALPAGILFLQVVASLRRPPVALAASKSQQRIGVLMPAHNEALGIAEAIASVRAQLQPNDRLVVVADNCDDATAEVAASAGAEVIVRHDASRRGKGYALDHGVRHYASAPVDVIVIVDADCILHPGALRTVSDAAVATGRPAQALYLMRSPPGAGVKIHVAEFAWRVRNQIRPLGCLALGWPCQLMGTGMAFPWSTIERAPLASGHLVEDMELGLALAGRGTPPVFCPSALVTSEFATDERGSGSQRVRWEHGHLGMIATRALPVLGQALRSRQPALAAMALDLCVPPLASLVLVQGLVLLLTALWAGITGHVAPVWIVAIGAAMTTAAILIGWRVHARDVLTTRDALAIPGYVLGKLPIYLRWFTRRQTEWVRTARGTAAEKASRPTRPPE